MSFFGSPSTSNAQAPKYTGVQVQTSAYGVAIPIVYGTTRMAVNIGWYGNFKRHVHKSGGGKGGITGSGGKGGTSTTTYTADVLALICEGPINGIFSMWSSQTHKAGLGDFSAESNGAYGQTPWAYLVSSFPQDAFPYSGVAWMAQVDTQLGSSAALPNINVEVQGFFNTSTPSTYGGRLNIATGGDADPSLIIPDLLTNGHYGVGLSTGLVGQPVAYVDTFNIPTTPFQHTVTHSSTFMYNMDVVDNAGNLFTCVASSPVHRQYSFTNGVYTFAAADVGTNVTINYAASSALTQYQNWCLSNGLWFSVAIDSAQQASTILQDMMYASYSEAVWSSGILNIVPRGVNNVTGNGYTFNAPSSAVATFGINELMPNQNPTGTISSSATDDPIIVSRLRVSDQINDIKIEVLDRNQQYAPSIVEATDQGLIDRFGRRAGASKTLHLFADVNAGSTCAQLWLQDQYIRNRYSFQLDEHFCWLDPMDLILLTDPNYPSLTNVTCRILDITENDDGTLSVAAEQYPTSLGLTPSIPVVNNGGGLSPELNVDAGVVNTPIFYTVPPAIASNQTLELWGIVSGVNTALYGGCQVWVATAAAGPYQFLGMLQGASRMGVSTTDLPGGVSDPDNTHFVTVDLSQSAANLASGTQHDADTDVTLCLIGGVNGFELISYQTATLLSGNTYQLGSYLRRGQYSTKIVDHPIGSVFARLDNEAFTYTLTPQQIGQTLYFKFPTFNIYEGGQQSLAVATVYPTVVGYPPPPPDVTGFGVSQQGSAVVFTWNAVKDALALQGYTIGYAPVGSTLWSQFQILTDTGAGSEMTNAAVPPGTWLFGIRAVDIAGQLSTDITTLPFTIYNESNVITGVEADPGWVGAAMVGFVQHFGQKCLTPISTKTCDQYVALSPPATPTTGSTAGGAIGATTYFVKTTYVTGGAPQTANIFETLPSAEKSQAVGANNVLTVTSPAANAQATGYNVYVSTTTGLEQLQNATPIPIGTGWTEPVTGLIAGASVPSSNTTGWEWVYGVPDVYVNPYFENPQIDLGFNTSVRLWYSVTGALLPTVPGSATYVFQEDNWLSGNSDPNTFTPFTFGNLNFRYLRDRIYETTSNGAAYISAFYTEIDGQPSTEQSAQNIVVPASNTTAITFPTAFHTPPLVKVTAINNTGLYASASSVTTTGFIPHVWDHTGTEVGGTISWEATGL